MSARRGPHAWIPLNEPEWDFDLDLCGSSTDYLNITSGARRILQRTTQRRKLNKFDDVFFFYTANPVPLIVSSSPQNTPLCISVMVTGPPDRNVVVGILVLVLQRISESSEQEIIINIAKAPNRNSDFLQ